MTSHVKIVEVGPRNGLQNEATPLSMETRVAFIERLLGAGLETVEVGSFVSPKWVPQMAGTAEVLEGAVETGKVVSVSEQLASLGCYEISLGDTVGTGTPGKVRQLIKSVANAIPVERAAIHFHDTYGQALANIYSALEQGVSVVDAAAGGLGGCPYARGASGNVATETVVHMLDGMGVDTGVNLMRLLEAVDFMGEALGRASQSAVFKALAHH